MEFDMFKIEVFIPEEYVDNLREALNNIGALTVGGNYDSCMSKTKVVGYWRPLDNANPFNGEVGKLCTAEEMKVEFCSNNDKIKQVIEIIRKVHPYEEPVINIIPVLHYKKFI